MKNVFKISILILIALFMMPEDMDAQNYGKRRKKKKKKKAKTEKVDERNSSGFDWKEKLWFGAGGTLNFAGNEIGNEFIIGLTPMVGYKIQPWLSVGPRLELTYNTGRFDLGNIVGYNAVDYGAGVFLRVKSPFNVYLHTEYFLLNDQCLSDGTICSIESPNNFTGVRLDPEDTSNLLTKRVTRDAMYIGLGYNSQNGFSKWGYEIQLNYDILAPETTTTLPIDLRFGLTYNF